MNREHDSVAKTVVALPRLPGNDQARGFERLALIVGESMRQRLPIVGGVADAEARSDRSSKTACFQIVDCTVRIAQLAPIVFRGLQEHAGQIQSFASLCLVCSVCGARHIESRVAGKLLDRFRKGPAPELHQETDGGAMGAASEAMVELLGWAHRERRSLFAVKRTAGDEVSARFF